MHKVDIGGPISGFNAQKFITIAVEKTPPYHLYLFTL